VNLADAALRDAILKVLADAVMTALKDGRAELREVMTGNGIRSLTATLPDGTTVATVTLAGGQPAPRVTSQRKFLDWVTETHPSQTETVVRPGYQEQLLKAIAKAGRAVDPGTGEVVPGVEFAAGDPYVTTRFTGGGMTGRDLVRRAWRERQVDPLAGLAALPAPQEAPDAA
jgi:hypothetical protein